MTDAASTISFSHGGTEWQLPVDLVELQQRWDGAHCAVDTYAGDAPEALNELRERRRKLTDELAGHRWLREQMELGRRYQADMALKAYARRPR